MIMKTFSSKELFLKQEFHKRWPGLPRFWIYFKYEFLQGDYDNDINTKANDDT